MLPRSAAKIALAYQTGQEPADLIGWTRSYRWRYDRCRLSEAVSDEHLVACATLDLPLALDILELELGMKRLLLEGSGGTNGCLSAGRISPRA
jgi:hypothetical protein